MDTITVTLNVPRTLYAALKNRCASEGWLDTAALILASATIGCAVVGRGELRQTWGRLVASMEDDAYAWTVVAGLATSARKVDAETRQEGDAKPASPSPVTPPRMVSVRVPQSLPISPPLSGDNGIKEASVSQVEGDKAWPSPPRRRKAAPPRRRSSPATTQVEGEGGQAERDALTLHAEWGDTLPRGDKRALAKAILGCAAERAQAAVREYKEMMTAHRGNG